MFNMKLVLAFVCLAFLVPDRSWAQLPTDATWDNIGFNAGGFGLCMTEPSSVPGPKILFDGRAFFAATNINVTFINGVIS